MYVSVCKRSTFNCIMSLCHCLIYVGPEALINHVLGNIISIPRLTPVVKLWKYHSDTCHPSIAFIYMETSSFIKSGRLGVILVAPAVSKCMFPWDWLTCARQRKSETNLFREMRGEINPAIQSWVVDECEEDLRKINALIDRSLNTANADRWGEK